MRTTQLFQKFIPDLFITGIAFCNDAAHILAADWLVLPDGHIGNDQHHFNGIEQVGINFLLFAGPSSFRIVTGAVDGVGKVAQFFQRSLAFFLIMKGEIYARFNL